MSVVNVKNFGAIGDGVTDDTPAFLDALDILLNTFEKGVLYCPSGTYKITQQLVIDKPFVGIKGDGIQATTLLFPASSGVQLSSYVDFSMAAIEDLTISGPGHSASGVYDYIGIDMPTSNFYFLNRFLLINFDIGINGSVAVLNKFENFSVGGCKIGMQFASGSYMNTILNGNVRACTEVGILESGSRILIAMSDIEAIGVFNPSTGKYEGGTSIRTGINTEIRDCHFELSEIGIGLGAPDARVTMENCYLGDCVTGVKQLQPGGSTGRYIFRGVRFTGSTTEFDIPGVTIYEIEDCQAKYGTGADKAVVINAHPNLGTVKDLEWSTDGFWITHEALGMKVRDRQVWHGKFLLESIAVGTVNANSTASFTVTDPTSSLTEWSDVVNVAIQSYTLPAGLILTGYVQQFSTNTIGIHVTNTTGSNINVGTRNFIIKTM